MHALSHTTGAIGVSSLKLRWLGHRLPGAAAVEVDAAALHGAGHAETDVKGELFNLDEFTITPGRAH
ncbi:hypothetical protein GCM10022288_14560 [Gryllotalpicola kribbensis]|uniref:Uncharacterized protein n=1 Tax=Gryllotalpicola kribbensis TaxID=993084 RepID=A0ABP8AQS2_9MICO